MNPCLASVSPLAALSLFSPSLSAPCCVCVCVCCLPCFLRFVQVDDGNNFGVEIQEESINEIAKIEDVGFLWLDKLANYHGNRTRIIAKISKYPAILDYWQSVRELDESFFVDLRMHMVDMRNSYTILHDLLLKNEERIKNPRGEEGAEEGRNRRHAFA